MNLDQIHVLLGQRVLVEVERVILEKWVLRSRMRMILLLGLAQALEAIAQNLCILQYKGQVRFSCAAKLLRIPKNSRRMELRNR